MSRDKTYDAGVYEQPDSEPSELETACITYAAKNTVGCSETVRTHCMTDFCAGALWLLEQAQKMLSVEQLEKLCK